MNELYVYQNARCNNKICANTSNFLPIFYKFYWIKEIKAEWMKRQEMNPQDMRLEITGLDIDQLYIGGRCHRLTSGWREDWSTFSTVLNRLKTQCSAWFCFYCCLTLFRLKLWQNITEPVRKQIEMMTEGLIVLLNEIRTENLTEWLRD